MPTKEVLGNNAKQVHTILQNSCRLCLQKKTRSLLLIDCVWLLEYCSIEKVDWISLNYDWIYYWWIIWLYPCLKNDFLIQFSISQDQEEKDGDEGRRASKEARGGRKEGQKRRNWSNSWVYISGTFELNIFMMFYPNFCSVQFSY